MENIKAEITWIDVKKELPKRKGLYLIADGAECVSTGLYRDKKWYLFGFESEIDGQEFIEAYPYAWAKYPKAPSRD